jgi:hypothetical protein
LLFFRGCKNFSHVCALLLCDLRKGDLHDGRANTIRAFVYGKEGKVTIERTNNQRA